MPWVVHQRIRKNWGKVHRYFKKDLFFKIACLFVVAGRRVGRGACVSAEAGEGLDVLELKLRAVGSHWTRLLGMDLSLTEE